MACPDLLLDVSNYYFYLLLITVVNQGQAPILYVPTEDVMRGVLCLLTQSELMLFFPTP